ncbi:MAG TPA: YsnF/AvaK domain-containing protein [Burkholderiales bacterium]
MATGEPKIALVREELTLGKRKVESGRVRIRKQVRVREQEIEQDLLREEVEVRRVPADRVLDAPPEPRREGDTLIIPVVEEVLVQRKVLRLREELHVRRRAVRTPHRERVLLRSEEAVVERTGKSKPAEPRRRTWPKR